MRPKYSAIRKAITILFFMLAVLPSPVWAREAADPFPIGIAHFKAGEFGEALKFFTQATDAGRASGPLFFNIGVCHYKLADYQSADQAFTKAATYEKMTALANYNRGLVALKAEKNDQAYLLFRKVIEQAKDQKLAQLAEVAIFKAELDKKSTGPNSWLNYFSIGLGFDDNVKITSESDTTEASGEEDAFAEMIVYARGPLFPESKIQAQLNVYYQGHKDLDEYDIISPGLGFYYVNNFNGWKVDSGLQYTFTLLDDQSHEQIGTASIKLTKMLNSFTRFNLNYYLSSIDLLNSDYEYLDGYRNKLETKGTWRLTDWRISLGYYLELNDAEDSESAPTRNFLAGGVKYYFTSKLNGDATISGRKSVYDYNLSENREDNLYKASAGLTYSLSGEWLLNLSYTYYDNDSNYDLYDYQREIVTTSISKSF
ncbi:MAG: outer membrane beta-barrel protein [Proteobacteria bacterium]|nr:outer membrane beta-barrel protein [Pseudomonadota bacterium]MBU1715139.1 outer membrane beta-barrel protein [Pseudomonadota bacterium]